MSKLPSICLDHKHCREICDEIGYRLSVLLRPETALPERLKLLLDRLIAKDLQQIDSPPISPSVEATGSFAVVQTPCADEHRDGEVSVG